MPKEKFHLKLKSKTAVFVDWANVHGWEKSLNQKIDAKKLFHYLKSYPKIGNDIYFYFGTDITPESKRFINLADHLGYKVTTKPVKYIFIKRVNNEDIYQRKCDFDIEICINVHKFLAKNYQGFVFFTGDGDFTPLYQLLIQNKKQVIIIFAQGHLGKEIRQINKRVFLKELDKLGIDLYRKNIPPVSRRA